MGVMACRGRQAAASRNRVTAVRFAGSWDSRLGPLRTSQVPKKRSSWALKERGRQFEATRPQMLEVGEMLAAPALEDLIPARHEVGDRAGPEGCGCRKQLASLKEQKAIILMPPDCPEGMIEAHQEELTGRLHCWRD